jgi:hypothetical protein
VRDLEHRNISLPRQTGIIPDQTPSKDATALPAVTISLAVAAPGPRRLPALTAARHVDPTVVADMGAWLMLPGWGP